MYKVATVLSDLTRFTCIDSLFFCVAMGLPPVQIDEEEVDIVISATSATDLSFLEVWRPIFQPYHLILVQNTEVSHSPLPQGFNLDAYTLRDMKALLGPELAASLSFTTYACRSFGFLVSKRRYVFTVDEDCVPPKDESGNLIDVLKQHITNLKHPSVPYFFNTLYDPYREGTDFVRGYPFSLRLGVPTVISHGLWLNLPDYEPRSPILTSTERRNSFVDAVLTVPKAALFSMSGINLSFDREIIGLAMFFGFSTLCPSIRPFSRSNSLDDIWAGFCCKVICDHLGYGIKTGLPYVWRNEYDQRSSSVDGENKGFHQLDEIVSFFKSLSLPRAALSVEDCYLEISKQVKTRLNSVDPLFEKLGSSMQMWVEAWKKASS